MPLRFFCGQLIIAQNRPFRNQKTARIFPFSGGKVGDFCEKRRKKRAKIGQKRAKNRKIALTLR